MSLGTTDERDLLLPLFAGIDEQPVWNTFLQRLLARTRAQRLHLFIRPAGTAGTPPFMRTIRAGNYVRPAGFFDLETFSNVGLLPFTSLRPNRVYSLEETMMPKDPELRVRHRQVLAASSVAAARFIRITSRGDHDAWIVLLHDRLDFSAEDSALLSALAPHVALALTMLMELRGLRLRATIAEEALAHLGIGQAVFDSDGQVILADDIAQEELQIKATGRPQIRATAAQDLVTACRALSTRSTRSPVTVRFDDRAGKDILLRRGPAVGEGQLRDGFSVGLVRRPQSDNGHAAAAVIAATLRLSMREAALAHAMSQGQSIVEAGSGLQLTRETARNYSKRIYAKTGTSGQADLVRMILKGLAPFA